MGAASATSPSRIVADDVGDLNHGWQIARTTLSYEQSTLFMASQLRFATTVDAVIDVARRSRDTSGRPRKDDPELRQRIARAWVHAQLIRVNGARNLGRVLGGGEVGPEGSIAKLFGQESEQLLSELALDAAGPTGVLDRGAEDAPDRRKWSLGYLRARASTIAGGTSEIQRNILAERVLGLPRDPWAHEE